MDPTTLLRPERAATDTIRGFVSQALWSVLRWFDLSANELLICEGNEDIDRVLFDNSGHLVERTEEQLKDLAGRVSARTPDVHDSLFNFLRAFHAHDQAGVRCRWVFTTTATLARQNVRSSATPTTGSTATPGADLEIDVLDTWMKGTAPGVDSSQRAKAEADLPKAITELARYYLPAAGAKTTPAEAEHAARVREALSYLNTAPTCWVRFIDAVVWSLGQESLSELQTKLLARAEADARTRALPSDLIIDRLIVAALRAMAKPDPTDRVLTPEILATLATANEAELRQWASNVHREVLARWIDLDQRVADLDVRVTHIEVAQTPEAIQGKAVEACVQALGDRERQDRQGSDIWLRYFYARVIPSLFVEPYEFPHHVALFERRTGEVEHLQAQLLAFAIPDSLAAAARGVGANASLSSFTETLERCARLLKDGAYGREFRTALSDLVNGWRTIETDVSTSLASQGPSLPAEGADTKTLKAQLTQTAYALEALVDELWRVGSVLWCLSTPAGRGKSIFLWEVASRLRKDGHCVCLITGRGLDGTSPIETVVARELQLPHDDSETFLAAGRARWATAQQPVFVIIDAVNEARSEMEAAVDQVVRFAAVCEREPWLRLLFSCRDLYWHTAFEPDLSALLDYAIVDGQSVVSPSFDAQSIAEYLSHFRVQGVKESDFAEPDWESNPLLLRVFCETYADSTYGGPKPIPLRSFRLLRSYFARKERELHQRGFRTLRLEEELDRIAAAMIEGGRESKVSGSEPRFVVAETRVRGLLQATANGEPLYDALVDMDLVLQVDIQKALRRYVTFTFERMQDYFIARVLLQKAEGEGVALTDTFLDEQEMSSAVTYAASATTIALAIEQEMLPDIRGVPQHAALGLPIILDLVEPDRLRPWEGDLAAAVNDPTAVSNLREYLRDRLELQSAIRRTFLESFGLGVLATAALRMALPERHRYFYNDRVFIDALADMLVRETNAMRGWARRGFSAFPRQVSGPDGRLRTAVLLLGANSSEVRDLAHEWLFWFGRFDSERVCAFADEFIDHNDLFIRERVLALIFALLHRLPKLATERRLLAIHAGVLDRSVSSYTGHYLITEFARKILLEHRNVIVDRLTPTDWQSIEHPVRIVSSAQGPQGFGTEPEWTRRGPIGPDQSHYTFRTRFRSFDAPNFDTAVEEALLELPRLGYDEATYDDLDEPIQKEVTPRIRPGGRERSYERFGKSYAHQASWVVLGRWAETVPVKRDVPKPDAPFALGQPPYDPLFSLSTPNQASEEAPATIDFPETFSPEVWTAFDETICLAAFVSQFPGEVVVDGVADRIKGNRQLQTQIRCALLYPPYEAAFAWSTARLQAKRHSFYGEVPKDDVPDLFEFHHLRDAVEKDEPINGLRPVVALCNEFTRTMNGRDRSVTTLSARVIRAADLRQLETEGEFADASGDRVVRLLAWGGYNEEHRGDIVLLRQDILERVCTTLGVSYCFFDFYTLIGLDEKRGFDNQLNIPKWAARFPRLSSSNVPPFLDEAVSTWETTHERLGIDDLVRCYRASELSEDSLREMLATLLAEHTERTRPRLSANSRWGAVFGMNAELVTPRGTKPEGGSSV